MSVTVTTSKQSSSTILFAKNGEGTVRQTETVTTTEYRGSDVGVSTVSDPTYSSNYAETTWYKSIDGKVYTYTAITGTKTEWSASRTNDAGMWRAYKKETVYGVSGGGTSNGWTTTEIDDSGSSVTPSATGVTVLTGSDKSISYVFCYSGQTLYQTTLTQTYEVRHLTQNAATELVTNAAANNISYVSVRATSEGGNYTVQLPVGTETVTSSSMQDDNGWTVIKTVTTRGWTGSGWSQLT